MESYYDLDLIKRDNDKYNLKINYHLSYENPVYGYEHFKKNKGEGSYQYTYDINNPRVKEYMLKNPEKFKTMCLSNIYLSKIVKRTKFKDFEALQYCNIFKEYSSKYIDNPNNILLNTNKNMRKEENFNKTYNMIFNIYKPSPSERSHKSQFKKEYKKYLETNDIEQCKFKHSLQIFIAYVELSEQSSPTLEPISTFDIVYNLIFKECKKKHRYSQKCKLKKEYNKYLECGDIDQCNLKDLLYMIIYAIDSHSPSLDSSTSWSGVST